MIADVIIVGIIVGLAAAALVIIIVRSLYKKGLYGRKQQELLNEARKVKSSSLVG